MLPPFGSCIHYILFQVLRHYIRVKIHLISIHASCILSNIFLFFFYYKLGRYPTHTVCTESLITMQKHAVSWLTEVHNTAACGRVQLLVFDMGFQPVFAHEKETRGWHYLAAVDIQCPSLGPYRYLPPIGHSGGKIRQFVSEDGRHSQEEMKEPCVLSKHTRNYERCCSSYRDRASSRRSHAERTKCQSIMFNHD